MLVNFQCSSFNSVLRVGQVRVCSLILLGSLLNFARLYFLPYYNLLSFYMELTKSLFLLFQLCGPFLLLKDRLDLKEPQIVVGLLQLFDLLVLLTVTSFELGAGSVHYFELLLYF